MVSDLCGWLGMEKAGHDCFVVVDV